MATLSAVKIIESGITSSLADCAAAGDDFVNTGLEFIRIQNTHATATYSIKLQVNGTVSVKHPQYGTLTKSDIYKSISSPGGSGATSAIFGPFKPGSWNDSNEKVKIFYKTGTGVNATDWNALGTTLAGSHLLKIEVLYLDN
jgi:hypothetical protein